MYVRDPAEFDRLLAELVACVVSVVVHDRPTVEPTAAELRRRGYMRDYMSRYRRRSSRGT